MSSATSQNYDNIIMYKCGQDKDNSLSSPESVSVCKETRWLQTMHGVLTHVTRMNHVMSTAAKENPHFETRK